MTFRPKSYVFILDTRDFEDATHLEFLSYRYFVNKAPNENQRQ